MYNLLCSSLSLYEKRVLQVAAKGKDHWRLGMLALNSSSLFKASLAASGIGCGSLLPCKHNKSIGAKCSLSAAMVPVLNSLCYLGLP